MPGTLPSILHTAVNAIDATGRTQLSHACASGDYELVKKLLLDPKVDIALEDDSGMSPVEYAEKFKHVNCAALLRNEAHYRAKDSSNAFLTSLRAELMVANGADFDERLFHQAVENDPAAAAKYLDQFVSSGRYDYTFTQLDAICGRKNVKSSALYSVLNDSIVDDGGAKHDLLQHVVLQRVLDVKWELFGARKYYQQLLLYILMLGAVLTTVTFDFRLRAAVVASRAVQASDEVERAQNLIDSFPAQLTLWLAALVFAFFAFIHLRHLKPRKFTKLTRWMYDGKYVFDPAFAIPEAAVYKAQAKAWLLRRTLLWTILVATPIVVVYALERRAGNNMGDLVLAATAFLGYWLLAFYFLHLEVKELLGEDPWLVQRRANANLIGKLFWSIVIVLYVPITPFLVSYRNSKCSRTSACSAPSSGSS
ncbi:hypothetical protein SPRG_18457 [Saprolegnia parasitica CBS 223.65]|uniref:Uncharacterized protein n=1 Tax=Saprolegnia parasitica (strain CBS 223.65) TaxID=695850 RepID=A0A067BGX8_SAPPC|nr:hypothetical protein SPRG_18457 [Saprolegnia parasitica CBS 223.65]KDO16005.1 hypothetical protein SPRG_18457 [Saprolegnia parasitica CBS 223.65]|eukprot:XP_012213286.1 hypothetical protein SPRG_18457 [Saprolegnia parasitica CBS 223.65]